MSLKHAILGFLSFKPFSGYDLKKAFDSSVRHFWQANQSQIYRTLAELDDAGLVEKEVIEREERLDMKIYHITPAGEAELHRWLTTPLPSSEVREPFLIQIYFGGKVADAEVLPLLAREIEHTQALMQVYRDIYDRYASKMSTADDPRALFFSLLTLEYGILSAEAQLRWLQSAKIRLEAGDYRLGAFDQLTGCLNPDDDRKGQPPYKVKNEQEHS
ncbi:MAG: PadR family transcriptional regulator [Anaerolineae bacterium]|jgi:DNA-binding PadR family transcriptional regulator|nr:PadR family transcriptional regulator [Anaerolineae bacterium]